MFGDKLRGLKENDGSIEGFVHTVEESVQILNEYETQTTSRFVCVKRPSSFGKQGVRMFISLSPEIYCK